MEPRRCSGYIEGFERQHGMGELRHGRRHSELRHGKGIGRCGVSWRSLRAKQLVEARSVLVEFLIALFGLKAVVTMLVVSRSQEVKRGCLGGCWTLGASRGER